MSPAGLGTGQSPDDHGFRQVKDIVHFHGAEQVGIINASAVFNPDIRQTPFQFLYLIKRFFQALSGTENTDQTVHSFL